MSDPKKTESDREAPAEKMTELAPDEAAAVEESKDEASQKESRGFTRKS